MRSALRQKVGRGEISAAECARLLQAMDSDLASGVYSTPAIAWPDVYLEAESLSASQTVSTLCRSLDILHVALAVVLGASEFCTFDVRQVRASRGRIDSSSHQGPLGRILLGHRLSWTAFLYDSRRCGSPSLLIMIQKPAPDPRNPPLADGLRR
jgi:hypothetical protein